MKPLRIHIINGPNLNMLGQREPNVYGSQNFESFFDELKQDKRFDLTFFQSNVEGVLIDDIQKQNGIVDGIILNAGGYTHTSVAIADAISAISTPVIEVHISNIFAREEYRHNSIIGGKCIGSITGFGLKSYRLALEAFLMREK